MMDIYPFLKALKVFSSSGLVEKLEYKIRYSYLLIVAFCRPLLDDQTSNAAYVTLKVVKRISSKNHFSSFSHTNSKLRLSSGKNRLEMFDSTQ